MSHPPEWMIGEPCPACGSPDILECELRIGADQFQMGWECRDCGYSAIWKTSTDAEAGHTIERRIVDVMPLHAITALYGERGLRERFATETARLGDSAGRRKVKQALQLASRLHALDHRQREPFVNHLLRVGLRITCHYEVRDADIICAALLHDTVEDHADDLSAADRPGAFAVLTACFGPQVADLVAALTNPIYAAKTDEHDQYREHVAASLETHPWARVVKAADFTDNGVGLIYTTGPKAAKLARKYAPLIPVLADLVARPDTPLTCHVKARILRQLRNAEERFTVITAATAAREGR
ncbi:HD domain-containing protein [Trebonia sp.]|uniref:HD domain-containing protein n=1 Tax=Trebonia sp. TaxID=2767075 RepID=UPI002623525F|nr:HD domain-containing protein [Trebonia sp.]